MGKNLTYWRRNTCGMVCEIATSVIFALFFIYIGTQSKDTDKQAQSYLDLRKRIGVGADSLPPGDWVKQQTGHIAALTRPNPLQMDYYIQRVMK